jgi:7,8-dihydropterin-6-yl-methyl-4-(beta-D-ribofuranosyl)aminobenzene 5'-phosphate synthase
MRITTLIENSPHPEKDLLTAEHGLSFYVEQRGHIFISDVGLTSAFADNAAILNADLTRVEALAITHHHYDHGGGLARFVDENQQAKIYLRQSDSEDFVVKQPLKRARYVGLDQAVIENHTARIVYLSENREVLPGIHLLTTIPQVFPKPSADKRLRVKYGSKIVKDTFEHELATILEGDDGLVLLTGCAHNGVLNMIAATKLALPGLPIRAVIGGFHLGWEREESVRQIGLALLESDIPEIYTGHCTGDKACLQLKSILGDRLQILHTGMVLAF